MGEHHVTSHFQQLLCPDPNCEVCNRTTEELLWRQTKTSMTFQTLENMKERNGPFSGQKRSEDHLKSSWNSVHSLVAKRDTTVSKTGLKIKGKPELLEISDQLLYVKTIVGDLGQKYSQLFWGLPCLHSESVVDTLLVSRSSCPLENHLVLFNGVCKAPVVQMQDTDSSPLPQFHPFPLTFVHPPSFPYMEPECHTLPVCQVHSQAHMNSPSSFPPCRNIFHGAQNRPGSDILSENPHLECHVLQVEEARVWALGPECQQYHGAFYPSAPHFQFVRQSSQDYVPDSVIQENLEPQEPNCLILPQCFQSCCDPGQLVVMEHHCQTVDTVHDSCKYADSQPLEHWGHSCEDLRKKDFSQAGSFSEKDSTRTPLRKDVANNLSPMLGNCLLNDPPMISECHMLNSVGAESETRRGWVCHSRIASGHELPSVSRKMDDSQVKSILRLHVSRKFWQITMGRIPIKVCHSWLADETIMSPGKSPNNMEKKNLSPLLGRIYCCIHTLELSFLDHKTQQLLENHIIRFRVSQKWGFPLKVLESIKLYMLREVKPWPFPQSEIPSPFTHISSVDLKTRFLRPLRGSTKFFQENKVGAINSAFVPDHPLPATSFVDKEGEGSLRRSHCDGDHEVPETVQKAKNGRWDFLHLTDSSIHKGSQSNTVLENQRSQEQSRKQDMAMPGSGEERVKPAHTVEMHQGNQMVEKNSEHCLTSSMSREVFMAHELGVLPSESDATSKLESSQMTNVDVTKVDTIWAPECDPPISIPKDPTPLEFKRQLLMELKLRLKSQLQSQAACSASDTSLSSDSLTFDSSLPSSNGEDMAACQKLRACLDDTGIFMEPWPEPPAFTPVLWKYQDKNCTPPKRRMIPAGPKREKGRHRDSGREISGAVKRSHPAKKGKLNQDPSPPESYFRKKMKHLFQWLSSPRESRGPISHEKDRALFMSCGPPEAHELMASLGKLLEEKLVHGQKRESLACNQGKKDMKLQPEPSPGADSNLQPGEESNPCFCSQRAISPTLSHIVSVGQGRDRIRHPEKIVASKK